MQINEMKELTEEEVEQLLEEQEEEGLEVEVEPEKEFDIAKIQIAYDEMTTRDPTKMNRTDYAKYQWLEQKLVDAGVIGEQAWEKEFELNTES